MMWSAVRLIETGGAIFRSITPLYIAVVTPSSDSTIDGQLSTTSNSTVTSAVTNSSVVGIAQLRQQRRELRIKIRSLVDYNW
eukprot:UN04968